MHQTSNYSRMNYGSNVIYSIQSTGANANGAFQFHYPDHFLQKKLSEVRSWRIIKSNFFDIWQNKNFADFGHADLEKRIPFGQNFWT